MSNKPKRVATIHTEDGVSSSVKSTMEELFVGPSIRNLIRMVDIDAPEGETLICTDPRKGTEWEFPAKAPFFVPKPMLCGDGSLKPFPLARNEGSYPVLRESGIEVYVGFAANGKPEVLVISGWCHNLTMDMVSQKWLSYSYNPNLWSDGSEGNYYLGLGEGEEK